MGIPAEVLQLASKQGGYVTRAQLVDIGMSARAIDRRVAAGDVVVVASALYQVVPSHDYVDLLRGALLRLPNAVVSHQSAAHLLRFPRLPNLLATVTVPSHTTHVFPGVTVHRCDDLESSDITIAHGLRLTNVVRTAFDLAGVLEYEAFEKVTESLILADRMKARHLERITSRLGRRGKRGAAAVRDFLDDRAGAKW